MNKTDIIPIEEQADPVVYESKAADLLKACVEGDVESIEYIRKYDSGSEDIVEFIASASNWTIDDARLVIARDHGFANWQGLIEHLDGVRTVGSPVAVFESAADAVVTGNESLLRELLSTYPGLVTQRSSRVHGATLLHYVSANGVEGFRQKTPANIVAIAEVLLATGAVADAPANLYDSKWCTTLDLVVSSVHPYKAGVQSALVEKLLDYGAAVNGTQDDDSPLMTALFFHYTEAAETLFSRGARVDTIVSAAALGLTDQVSTYLDASGAPLSYMPVIRVKWLNSCITPEQHLEQAFVWAAMHNRLEVVAKLLSLGVKARVTDQRRWTALHWAAFYAYPDMVELLLAARAPLEAQNEYGGTVLDQTLWVASYDQIKPEHPAVVETLIKAGAKVHSWWLLSDFHPELDERVAEVLQRYQ